MSGIHVLMNFKSYNFFPLNASLQKKNPLNFTTTTQIVNFSNIYLLQLIQWLYANTFTHMSSHERLQEVHLYKSLCEFMK